MTHDFYGRLAFSEGVILEKELIAHLLASIPGSIDITRATKDEDRSGVDYWISRHGLPSVGIDVKHRGFDPIERFGSDDACVETTSVYTGPPKQPWDDKYRICPGWTLNTAKRTDLVVYTWPASEGRRRFWVLYFPLLCRAAQLNWREWAERYGERAAPNATYLTLSVYPPRTEIAQAMRALTVGIV